MCSAPSEGHPVSERLFFALWPDEVLRQQLVKHSQPIVRHVHGRRVPAENFHITLAFLGDTDAHQRACVERIASTVAAHAVCFPLALDSVGHWSRSRVMWLGSRQPPEPLEGLAEAISSGARECGLSLESRPYRPHLTLVRKVSQMPAVQPIEPVSWWVDRMALLRSVFTPQGVRYDVVHEWPLGDGS